MKMSAKVILAIGITAILILAGWFGYDYFGKKKPSPSPSAPASTSTSASQISLSTAILNNKFGFLSGGPEDVDFIKSIGAGWVRPHPGGFVWERIQNEKNGQFDWSITDKEIQRYQKDGIAILATIWPFASWDQVNRSDQAKCMVSQNDEFAPGGAGEKKGAKEGMDEKMFARGYLPLYRCNPYDWDGYSKWVSAIVERYDGDGQDDMPGLVMPIKFWEVMNEPDLDGNERLDFYKEDATAYAELLIKTSRAIRQADSDAKVVIAGAAGGNDRFLDFYREVFKVSGVKDAFDITNIHCISNDDYQSFNVEPYKKMLAEFGLDNKPVWVTEAQAIVSSDQDINATQTLKSTQKALELGAERLFYTQYSFETSPNMRPPQGAVSIKAEISGSDPQKAYQEIIK